MILTLETRERIAGAICDIQAAVARASETWTNPPLGMRAYTCRTQLNHATADLLEATRRLDGVMQEWNADASRGTAP